MKHWEYASCITCQHAHKKFLYKECDMCGKTTKRQLDWQPLSDDDNTCESRIHYEHGWTCPDSGWMKHYELDICPACMTETIIPLINNVRKQRGVPALEPEEVDF